MRRSGQLEFVDVEESRGIYHRLVREFLHMRTPSVFDFLSEHGPEGPSKPLLDAWLLSQAIAADRPVPQLGRSVRHRLSNREHTGHGEQRDDGAAEEAGADAA